MPRGRDIAGACPGRPGPPSGGVQAGAAGAGPVGARTLAKEHIGSPAAGLVVASRYCPAID
jgi:hypothetical protein